MITGNSSPYQYRTVLLEIHRVASAFRSLLTSDKEAVNKFNDSLDVIVDIKDSLNDLKGSKNFTSEVAGAIEKMDGDIADIQKELLHYREAMQAAISNTSTYSDKTWDNPAKFIEEVFGQLKVFYLAPSLILFSKSEWMMSEYLSEDWIKGLCLKILQNLPDTQNEISVLIICLVSGIIVFLILNAFINSRSKLDKNKLKPFKKSLLWFFVAMFFVAYNYSAPFMPKNSIVFVLCL